MFDQIIALMTHNSAFFYGSVLVFSLVVGSFLNVVIHRLPIMMEREWECECREHLAAELKTPPSEEEPERYDLVLPRSACPKCGHQITALENIPIISWLVLKGKCANCRAHISARYPFVELLTGVLSVVIAVHFGVSMQTLVYLLLTWGLIALSFIDLDKMLLPDQITLPLVWLGLFSSISGITPLSPKEAIIGAMVGYLSLWSIYWLFKLVTKKEGFGYGDFKLLMVFGAFLGWQQVALIIMLSTAVGSIFGLYFLLKNKKSVEIPFGPYIAIAGWIAMIWGDRLINYYLNNFIYISH